MSVQGTAAPPSSGTSARLGPVFAVVAAGVAMSNLDMFIVNVALPQIGAHFDHAPLSSLSWVLNAYAVIFAALMVPAGNVADRIGARTAYLVGIAVFTVASVACALSPDVWSLVAARVVQAAGAAIQIPASLGLLLAAAPPDKRLTAVRGWTAISGVAAALGPVAGGLLTQADWRWVFLVNVPIGLAALAAGPAVLPSPPRHGDTARPDLLGAALFTGAIGTLALGIVKSSDWGWSSARVLGLIAGCVVLLALFVLRSARAAAPVLPLKLLRVPAFAPASLANVLFGIPFAAMLLSAILWTQDVWHWSPLETGLAVAPGPLMVPFLAFGGAPLVRRAGTALVTAIGSLVFAAGILWWILWMHAGSDYVTAMLPGMVLTGIGVGLTLPTLIGAAVSALPPQSFATGSAVVTMARQLGTVLGIAILVVVLTSGRHTAASGLVHAWWFVAGASVLTAVACLTVGRIGGGQTRR